MKKILTYSLIAIVLTSSFAVPQTSFAQEIQCGDDVCTGGQECFNDPQTGPFCDDPDSPAAQKFSSHNPNSEPDFGWFDDFFKAISNMVLTLVGTILWIAGVLFNFSVEFSIVHFKGFVTDVGAIEIGWQVIRDLINMAFIFILLYIAISTILGMGKDMKKLIINIIIAALLINFSLFFTKVIIDASNIMALQFYEAIAPGASSGGGIGQALQEANSGISNQFMQAVKITTTFPSSGQVDAASILGNASLFTTSTFLGSIFIMILAFVFFAAAFLFIIRFVILILLMVVSPVAFVGMMLPQAQHISSRWWKTLLDQAFFAPVFLILIYLVLTIVSHPGFHALAGDGKFVEGFAGGNLAIVLNFFIVIALAIAALTISKGMMSGAAGKAVDWATKTGGALTFGAPAWLGRRTIGWAGHGIAESKSVKRLRDSDSRIARTTGLALQRTGGFAAKSSFDVKSAPGLKSVLEYAGAGGASSGKGGYAKAREEAEKRDKKDIDEHVGAPNEATQDRIDDAIQEIDRASNRMDNAELQTAHELNDQLTATQTALRDATRRREQAERVLNAAPAGTPQQARAQQAFDRALAAEQDAQLGVDSVQQAIAQESQNVQNFVNATQELARAERDANTESRRARRMYAERHLDSGFSSENFFTSTAKASAMRKVREELMRDRTDIDRLIQQQVQQQVQQQQQQQGGPAGPAAAGGGGAPGPGGGAGGGAPGP